MMNKKILYFICGLCLSMTIFMVIDSYGLFESKNVLNVDSNIAKWNVFINGTDIKKNETFVVDKINLINNGNVLEGKMAPGSKGYFDIVIDPTDTDTSIRYDISFDFSSLNDKIVVSGIEEITSGNLVRTGKNTYSKVITLNEIKNGITNTIRVYIKWDNSDDESDSAIGSVINNFINVPVTIAAYQYLGEKIDIYNESTD